MKILLISNMYPSKQMPYSGIFVRNQFLKLSQYENVDIHYMLRKKTNMIGSLFKYSLFFLKFFKFTLTRYDIVHVHFFGYHYFLAIIYKMFYSKTKIIVTFHGSDTATINSSIMRKLAKKIDLIITVGSDQKHTIDNLLNVKTILLPAGIDEKIFYPRQLTKQYDFIFVGNFFKAKGLEIIIQAIQTEEIKDIRFCFIGQGELVDDLEALKPFRNVTVLAPQDQLTIAELLNKSNYLIFPSLGDSFGLVVSEALYCGVPAIVSNIGGMKDQITHGFNGFILESNDKECLIKYLIKCIKMPKDTFLMLQNNACKSNPEYSLESTCKRLIEIYKSLT